MGGEVAPKLQALVLKLEIYPVLIFKMQLFTLSFKIGLQGELITAVMGPACAGKKNMKSYTTICGWK